MIDLYFRGKHIAHDLCVLTYEYPTEGVEIYFNTRKEVFDLIRQLYELLDEGEIELKH